MKKLLRIIFISGLATFCGKTKQFDTRSSGSNNANKSENVSGNSSNEETNQTSSGERNTPLSQEEVNLAEEVSSILKVYCAECHGNNQTAQGGLGKITNFKHIIEAGYIQPFKPDESSIFTRLSSGMPPDGSPALNADQVKTLETWISNGALAPKDSDLANRKAITLTEEMSMANTYLSSLERTQARSTRFLSLRIAYVDGDDSETLKDLRQGVNKLLNSLSTNRSLYNPSYVDGSEETLIAISLPSLGWTENTWNQISSNYPYRSVDVKVANYRDLTTVTGDSTPIIRADWFLANSSRPPRYYAVLETSETKIDFFSQSEVSVDYNALFSSSRTAPGSIIRSGFNGSQVAEFSRVLERFNTASGFMWQSYEFGSSAREKNPFESPLGPKFPFGQNGGRDRDRSDLDIFGSQSAVDLQTISDVSEFGFEQDGNEIIYTLPNGMLAFAVYDGNGDRLAEAPTGSLDKVSSAAQVTVGVSCMSCHAKGLFDKKDQVSASVEVSGILSNNGAASAWLKNMYVSSQTFRENITKDSNSYQEKLRSIGVEVDRKDPVFATFNSFARHGITIHRAATELNTSVENLIAAIKNASAPPVRAALSPLLSEGGTVTRQVFEQNIDEL